MPSGRDHAAEPARAAREPAVAGPPARLDRVQSAADVLALQRRIGNAATRRWLARQASEPETAAADPLEANWANICATPVPAPAGPPQAIPADQPLIHSVVGPCLTHWAGGYHWFVRFQLPHPAPTRGYIIQELYQEGSGSSNEHFWEYWEVAAGDREPVASRTPSWVTPSGRPYDDRYVHGPIPGAAHARQGWYRHLGVVRFYPGPLPPQFTGADRYTRVMPDGWTGTGARHDCYAEWDRRPGRPRRLGLVATAGSQTYQAGDPVRGFAP